MKLALFPFLISFSIQALQAGEPSPLPAVAGDSSKEVIEISDDLLPEWGVAMAMRYGSTPFDAEDNGISDIFPLFYYEGDRFFLRGDYGGLKLWENDQYGFNAIARYRFYDIPEEYDDLVSGGGADMGLQAYWKLTQETQLQLELLSDSDGRFQAATRWAGDFRREKWRFFPEAEVLFTSSKFNRHYYGVGRYDLNAGVEARAKFKARRQLYKNLHVEGRVEGGWIGSDAQNSPVLDDSFEYDFYLGLGLFSDNHSESKSTLKAKSYWRISQGFGTSSDFQNILLGEFKTDDEADVNMTSIFYGHPLSDTLFGSPWDVYLTPGMVYHYSSDVQDTSLEFILAVKAYYTFPLPWRLRLGIAEGISYADSLTYYERNDLAEKEVSESKLLNYLDLSLDLNMGDVFNSNALEDLYLGAAIHHRSGIYGSSSAFGDVSGGTNFGTVYLQWHGNF
ncbi:MipA/OmpV family protein [Rubritalea sp.]|uniref:MipA/OmpV family protein n=1 Tax=Rubritalea sp. TaxID=2109375 RepID=UPI003EF8A8FB